MRAFSSRLLGFAVLLAAIGACSSDPPLIVGKERDVKQPATTFDTRDTVYAVANVGHLPEGSKVTGRLVIVAVAGQKTGPIRGFDMTIELLPDEKKASFSFPAPPAGWPNGKYKFEVIVLDKSGRERSRKSVDFTTTGFQLPKRAPEPSAAIQK